MTKTYTEKEFNDVLTSALMSLVDNAKDHDCSNAATGILMTGILILSQIKGKIFDDDTETITIKKE